MVVLVMHGLATVGLTATAELATRDLHVPYTSEGRKEAMQAAAAAVGDYGAPHLSSTLIMAGAFPNESPVPFVVAAVTDEPMDHAVQFTDLSHHRHRKHIMLALATVAELLASPRPELQYAIPADAQVGAAPLQAVAMAPPATDDGTRLFEQRNVHSAQHLDTLRRAVDDEQRGLLATGDADMANYLQEAASQIRREPFDTVPAEVAAVSQPTETWMQYEPYWLTVPYVTDALAAPEPQRAPPADFCPRCHADLHQCGFWPLVQCWFEKSVAWCLAAARGQPLPESPGVFVCGQEQAFVPAARGTVWDMRRVGEGIVVPLDFTARLPSRWNVDWLREQWSGYPNQEAVSHACDGADLKLDDMALQYCFTNHLQSIADGYDTCIADLESLRDQGYYEWFTELAFCPCRFNGQGCRPKGDGHRRIASGSCPYEPTPDAAGVHAYSINAQTRRLRPGPAMPRWRRLWRSALLAVALVLLLTKVTTAVPSIYKMRKRFLKERKPRFEHAMSDALTLRAIGDDVGEPVYVFSDDFRHFFYQIRLAARYLWLSGIMMVHPSTAALIFIVELGLAMGYTPCSNIAQSIGDALLWIWENMMIEADRATMGARLRQIMAARARMHGTRHGHPWSWRCYTDDVLFIVLGAARAVRTVVVWHRLLRTARILGAKVAKRQFGCYALFLGIDLLVTAIIAMVPEPKLARAIAGLESMVQGELAKELTRKLLGLLVHLSFVSPYGRASTANMWACLAVSRSDPVRLLPREAGRARGWVTRLRHSPAAPLDVAVRRRHRTRVTPPAAATATGQSDAFLEHGTAEGGLGGAGSGALWHAPVYLSSIGPAEYLAFWVHLIQMTNVHACFAHVQHFMDNLSAFFAATRESAHAAIMQWIFDSMTQCPAVIAVRGKLRLGQRWGTGLWMGDAASRGYRDALTLLGERLHISLEWQQISPASAAAIQRTVAADAELRRLETPPVAPSLRACDSPTADAAAPRPAERQKRRSTSDAAAPRSAAPRKQRATEDAEAPRRGARAAAGGVPRIQLLLLAILGLVGSVDAARCGHLPSHHYIHTDWPWRPGRIVLGELPAAHGAEPLRRTYVTYPRSLLPGGDFRSPAQLADVLRAAHACEPHMAYAYWRQAGAQNEPVRTTYNELLQLVMTGEFGQAWYMHDPCDGPSSSGSSTGVTPARQRCAVCGLTHQAQNCTLPDVRWFDDPVFENADGDCDEYIAHVRDAYEYVHTLRPSTSNAHAVARHLQDCMDSLAFDPATGDEIFFEPDFGGSRAAHYVVVDTIHRRRRLTLKRRRAQPFLEQLERTCRPASLYRRHDDDVDDAPPGGSGAGPSSSGGGTPLFAPFIMAMATWAPQHGHVILLLAAAPWRGAAQQVYGHLPSHHHAYPTYPVRPDKVAVSLPPVWNPRRELERRWVGPDGYRYIWRGGWVATTRVFVQYPYALPRGGEFRTAAELVDLLRASQVAELNPVYAVWVAEDGEVGGAQHIEYARLLEVALAAQLGQAWYIHSDHEWIAEQDEHVFPALVQSPAAPYPGYAYCDNCQMLWPERHVRQRVCHPPRRICDDCRPQFEANATTAPVVVSRASGAPLPWMLPLLMAVSAPVRSRAPPAPPRAVRPRAPLLLTVAAAAVASQRKSRPANTPVRAPRTTIGAVTAVTSHRRRRQRQHQPNPTASTLFGEADHSAFALNPADPGVLHDLCNAVDDVVTDGVNERTSKGETSAWNGYYVPYCRLMRTALWRTFEAALNPRRESVHACGFGVYVWQHIKPRTKADKQARVDSVRNVIAHVRRRHVRRGYTFASTGMMAHVFKGLTRRRLRDCGVATIRRAEAYTVPELVAMKGMTDGMKVGRRTYCASDIFWRSWRLVDTYTDQTGTRKSEIVGFTDVQFMHSDCVFVIDGVQYPDIGPAELKRLRQGKFRTAYVTVAVNVSKADQDGTKFGPSLVALSYNRANPMSFAVALADYYEAFPVRGTARTTRPLFTTDGHATWTAGQLDATLSAVMAATLTPAQRKSKTMHSKRVFCATALRDLKSSDGEIQALVRWSSLESLRIYARMGLEYQAGRRDLMLTANIDSMNAAARDSVPAFDTVDDIQDVPLDAATDLADAFDGAH